MSAEWVRDIRRQCEEAIESAIPAVQADSSTAVNTLSRIQSTVAVHRTVRDRKLDKVTSDTAAAVESDLVKRTRAHFDLMLLIRLADRCVRTGWSLLLDFHVF
jgi:hypothetical protein